MTNYNMKNYAKQRTNKIEMTKVCLSKNKKRKSLNFFAFQVQLAP